MIMMTMMMMMMMMMCATEEHTLFEMIGPVTRRGEMKHDVRAAGILQVVPVL